MPAQTWEQPTWSQREKIVHLSHELPHRVHDARIYPIIAPNGSTIIIYGHDNGITIVWRGGRPFMKPSARQAPKAKEPEIIMIDDDDDEPVQTPTDEFDNEEAEFDEEEPYDKVLQSETIQIGSSVLHLEVPDINLELNGSTQYTIPPFLREKLVVAVACADGSIRLLSMALSPNRNPGRRDVDEISIVEPQQSPPAVSQGLAMTWTGQQRATPSHADDDVLLDWSLLVATHSARAGGMLAVYHIALQDDGTDVIGGEAVHLLQEEYLQKYMTSITFNSAPYPARQHSQLLVAVAGAVRIYEPCPRKRYGQQTPAQGSWLTSFYAPFESTDSISRHVALGQHCHILDARWVCNGQAVMVLLQDGQWGLWDIEGIAPEPSKPSRSFKASGSSGGVSGGGVTRFALQGYARETSKAIAGKFNLSDGQGTAKEAKKLTPMTPNTRKVKQQALFNAPSPALKISGLPQGGISVGFIAPTKTGSRPDDSIVIWYESALYSIPSISSFWQRAANGSGDGNSLSRIEGFSTSNETISNVLQAPLRRQQSSVSSLQRDILVSAEHRLLMLCPAQSTPPPEGPVKRLFATESTSQQNGGKGVGAMDLDDEDVMRFDQDMLSKGQLDIGGLDRMLSGMNGVNDGVFGVRQGRNGGGLFGDMAQSKTRRVGFAAGF